jgi:hypothetical protein
MQRRHLHRQNHRGRFGRSGFNLGNGLTMGLFDWFKSKDDHFIYCLEGDRLPRQLREP